MASPDMCHPITIQEQKNVVYFLRGHGERLRSIVAIPPKIPTDNEQKLLQLVKDVNSDKTCVTDKTSFSAKAAVFIEVHGSRGHSWSGSAIMGPENTHNLSDDFKKLRSPGEVETYLQKASDEVVARVYDAMVEWGDRKIHEDVSDRLDWFPRLLGIKHPWSTWKRQPSVENVLAYIDDIRELPSCQCHVVTDEQVYEVLLQGMGEDAGWLAPGVREMSLTLEEYVQLLPRCPWLMAIPMSMKVVHWGEKILQI